MRPASASRHVRQPQAHRKHRQAEYADHLANQQAERDATAAAAEGAAMGEPSSARMLAFPRMTNTAARREVTTLSGS